ncbi:Diaminopropionate ammonia-lyase [Acididesulfobacillus acetoxydans]|uniref:Diaminopropionate ammonia-lyase n=1 Tax=Acididesulfobacillus acetoxydans TaxID=1561005 RepID=A0A8S0X736_9FIRM|nr:diaminopropionate ammonia-lyase [Acididesulfobacillus acetoxydans]CAA7602990.1 Diaminopropionate ammonia-lyase [Acididesulfobacillus acetoxydans]CEJ05872.1 Diaminopropionate ammonia-lyase [Acididesulfobacillus acetoxydans]
MNTQDENVVWTANSLRRESVPRVSADLFSPDQVRIARAFHRTLPGYQPTPLQSLDTLAKHFGVGGIYVKDESYRFGLKAFKALGGSYAIGRYLAERLEEDIADLPFAKLTSRMVREKLGKITFATTTDGNHGRGVAWTARQLRQRAVVYMPKGSSPYRLAKIREEGAEASISDLNYDDTVRLTAAKAGREGWVVVQDTAWEGYTKIPGWIMQGYGTMVAEAMEQLRERTAEKPTHVFVQAGVGALAGSVLGYLVSLYGCGPERPKTVVAESDRAACLYRSALAGDGVPRSVDGDMDTIMAGLACGEVNVLGWNILRTAADMFVACPDWVSVKGMRILGNPLPGDPTVISGESGAVTTGLLWALLCDPNLSEAREALAIDGNSRILLFSTEGDTDPLRYRDIVWNGVSSAAR